MYGIDMSKLTTKEYQQKLAELKLSRDQERVLKEVLESLMCHSGRFLAIAESHGDLKGQLSEKYWAGRMDGLNSVYRFIDDQIDCNDDFSDN